MIRKTLTSLAADSLIDSSAKSAKVVPRPPPGRGAAVAPSKSSGLSEAQKQEHRDLISDYVSKINPYMVMTENVEEFTSATYAQLTYTSSYYQLMFKHSPDSYFAMLTHMSFVDRNMAILAQSSIIRDVRDAIESDRNLIKKYGLHPRIVELINDLLDNNKIVSDFMAVIRQAEPIKVASGAAPLKASPSGKAPKAVAGSAKSTDTTFDVNAIEWDNVRADNSRSSYNVKELGGFLKSLGEKISGLNKAQLVEKLLAFKP